MPNDLVGDRTDSADSSVSILVTPFFSLLDFLRTVSKSTLIFFVLELISTWVKVNFLPSTRRVSGLALSLSSSSTLILAAASASASVCPVVVMAALLASIDDDDLL